MGLTRRLALYVTFATGSAAFAQAPEPPVARPVFSAESITPSNGDKPYPLMPGMFVTIYGHGLGPTSACIGEVDRTRFETPSPQRPDQGPPSTFIYPTSLCGVQVFVGEDAAGLLYVSERQINFKVPQSTPMKGTAELHVVHRGRASP